MLRWTRNAALVVLSMVLGMLASGCGKEEPPPGTTPGGPVKLTFWHIMNYEGPREVLADAVKRFEADHPNVTVEVQEIENDAFKQKLATEMAGGSPPDVFHTWGGGVLETYAKAGKVMPLTEALKKDYWGDSFNPRAMRFVTFDDEAYAVPLDLSLVVVWYNTELFNRYGVVPPTTWAELKNVCTRLKEQDVTPFALGNADSWPGAFYFIYLATRAGGVGLFENAAAGKASFADRRFVQAGRLLQELVEVDAFSKGFNGLDDKLARQQFWNGQAAMYMMGTWAVANCRGEKPEFLEKMDCFAFPTVGRGRGAAGTVVGGINAAFAVSSGCAHPQEAIELLRCLTAEQVAAGWAEIGRLPALKAGWDLRKLPRPTQRAQELLIAAPRMQLYYDQYLPPALAAEHKETTQALFAGMMTPQQAAEAMEKKAGESR